MAYYNFKKLKILFYFH